MFSLFKKKTSSYFTKEEQELIKASIKEAEHATSGEIRVFVEPKCKYVDPLDRAKEIFLNLKMDKTLDRNGVLLYMAFKHKQFAIYGDVNIFKTLGKGGFVKEATMLQSYLIQRDEVQGICHTIVSIGNTLKTNFPYYHNDKNELPDDIVFGK